MTFDLCFYGWESGLVIRVFASFHASLVAYLRVSCFVWPCQFQFDVRRFDGVMSQESRFRLFFRAFFLLFSRAGLLRLARLGAAGLCAPFLFVKRRI